MPTECLEGCVEDKSSEVSSNILPCINQIFRPSHHIKMRGYGNCLRCTSDLNNRFCEGYRPVNIKIRTFECFPQEVLDPVYTG